MLVVNKTRLRLGGLELHLNTDAAGARFDTRLRQATEKQQKDISFRF